MRSLHKLQTILALVLCIALLSSFVSCLKAPKSKENFTFLDDTGASVSLSEKPTRVAVLFSSFAEMWTLAGGEVFVSVGESVARGILPESTFLVDKGAGKQISDELLLSSAPDFVIGSADVAAQRDAVVLMREAGIPAALFHVESFEDYARVMKIFTDLTQRQDLYAENVENIRAEIAAIKAALTSSAPPRILFVRCGSKYSATKAKTAKENFVCAMLEELGCANVADIAPLLLDGLNIEIILKENPDYIFFSTMGDEEASKAYMESVLKDPLWQSLTAVKEGKYAYLPKDMFQYKPNARWADAYRYLSELLYEKNEP